MVTPLLILLAGFQGSGKTTLAQKLVNAYGLKLISPDTIRQELFDRGVKFSTGFANLVDKTRNEQVKDLIIAGKSVVCDTNMVPQRIAKIVKDLSGQNYRLVTIFLKAPRDVLAQRVGSRPQIEGVYRGTTGELEDALEKHGAIPKNGYTLVIDTKKCSPEETFRATAQAITHARTGLATK